MKRIEYGTGEKQYGTHDRKTQRRASIGRIPLRVIETTVFSSHLETGEYRRKKLEAP
ncbi:MAG: hypothetical protein JRE40_12380 [Deltaproteobacteria bacterium]|nr:hypothetical protein [Deltaproteobacteria bacterium]